MYITLFQKIMDRTIYKTVYNLDSLTSITFLTDARNGHLCKYNPQSRELHHLSANPEMASITEGPRSKAKPSHDPIRGSEIRNLKTFITYETFEI